MRLQSHRCSQFHPVRRAIEFKRFSPIFLFHFDLGVPFHFDSRRRFVRLDEAATLRCCPYTLVFGALDVQSCRLRRLVPGKRHHALLSELGIAKLGHATMTARVQRHVRAKPGVRTRLANLGLCIDHGVWPRGPTGSLGDDNRDTEAWQIRQIPFKLWIKLASLVLKRLQNDLPCLVVEDPHVVWVIRCAVSGHVILPVSTFSGRCSHSKQISAAAPR